MDAFSAHSLSFESRQEVSEDLLCFTLPGWESLSKELGFAGVTSQASFWALPPSQTSLESFRCNEIIRPSLKDISSQITAAHGGMRLFSQAIRAAGPQYSLGWPRPPCISLKLWHRPGLLKNHFLNMQRRNKQILGSTIRISGCDVT